MPLFFSSKNNIYEWVTSIIPFREDFVLICLMIAVKPETRSIRGHHVCRLGLLLYFHGYFEWWKNKQWSRRSVNRKPFLVRVREALFQTPLTLFIYRIIAGRDQQRVFWLFWVLQHFNIVCYYQHLGIMGKELAGCLLSSGVDVHISTYSSVCHS